MFPIAKFGYNSLINWSLGQSLFEVGMGIQPCQPTDLIPFLLKHAQAKMLKLLLNMCQIHDKVCEKLVQE